MSSCAGTIGFGVYLLISGMENIGIYSIGDLYDLGFGAVNSNSVVGVAPTGLIATTLFANLPQGILSFLYLTYNGLFSCMLGAYEWNRFARSHKPLRVTAPIEGQRSTYYLQLPYIYAIVRYFALSIYQECSDCVNKNGNIAATSHIWWTPLAHVAISLPCPGNCL